METPLSKFEHIDVAIGLLTGLVLGCLLCFVFGPLGGLFGGAVAAHAAAAGSQRHRAALQLRIDSPGSLCWDVTVNNVLVGTISDVNFASLEKAVLGDWRVYGAQARNLASVGVRICKLLILTVPIALFWLGLGRIVVDPNGAPSLAECLRAAPGSEIAAAVEHYVTTVMLACAVCICMLAPFASRRLGYQNMFQEKLGEAVRRSVRAVAVGRLVLTPCQLSMSAPGF